MISTIRRRAAASSGEFQEHEDDILALTKSVPEVNDREVDQSFDLWMLNGYDIGSNKI